MEKKEKYSEGISKRDFDALVEKMGLEAADALVKSQYKPKTPDMDIKLMSDEEIIKATKEAFEDIMFLLRQYCDLNDRYYPMFARWILGTYTHETFNAFPFLFINAMRGSGKTRLLKLISALAKNGDIQANISEAVLFRTAKGSTILLDEMESIGSKEKGLLRELLNAAYKKGIKVKRMRKTKDEDGESVMEVEEFELYTPIAIANINGLDDVLADRCIHLILEKSIKKGINKRIEDFDTNDTILKIKRTLLANQCRLCRVVTQKNNIGKWNVYLDTTNDTNNTYYYTHTNYTNNLPTKEDEEVFQKIDESNIDSRNLELFFPLFVLARVLENGVFDEVLAIAKEMVDEKKVDETMESPDAMLYGFLATSAPIDWQGNYILINDITSKFKEHINEEAEYINSKWMGRALKRLNLISDKRRKGKGREVMINFNKARQKVMIFRPKWNGEERRKESKPVDEERRKT